MKGVPVSNATAAAFAAVMFAALYAGHQVGDHVVQSNTVAAAKSVPDPDALAAGVPPWTGWSACLRHVAGYAATQAAALALVYVVAPLEIISTATALVVSVSTHAVIDRRWSAGVEPTAPFRSSLTRTGREQRPDAGRLLR